MQCLQASNEGLSNTLQAPGMCAHEKPAQSKVEDLSPNLFVGCVAQSVEVVKLHE